MPAEEEVESALIIKNATLRYDKIIFTGLNLTIPTKKWVCLLGPSGIGKSSILKAIAGLLPEHCFSASIYIDNDLPLSEQIAYMGQNDLLLPWLTVLENAAITTKLHPLSTHEKQVRKQKAAELLAQVGLSDVLDHFPMQLSGGMRQRVALVRTLLLEKPIILMDEPFSALDALTRYTLQNLATKLLSDKTVLMITHDPQEAARLADIIWVLQGIPAILTEVPIDEAETPRAMNATVAIQTALFAILNREQHDAAC